MALESRAESCSLGFVYGGRDGCCDGGAEQRGGDNYHGEVHRDLERGLKFCKK